MGKFRVNPADLARCRFCGSTAVTYYTYPGTPIRKLVNVSFKRDQSEELYSNSKWLHDCRQPLWTHQKKDPKRARQRKQSRSH